MSESTSSSNPIVPNENPLDAYEVLPPPSDRLSSLSFNPRGHHLVATSWDGQVRCWEVQWGISRPLAAISHGAPAMGSAWAHDGTRVFSGGCDNIVKSWHLMTGKEPITVATHHDAVTGVAWIPEMKLLASSSFDETLRFWDIRQAEFVCSKWLPGKCIAMAVNYPLVVVGTPNQNIIVYNLEHPQEYRLLKSGLSSQASCLAIFPNKEGVLIGSLEGTVAVHHLIDSQRDKNFTFKCHHEGEHSYSVTSLNFHPAAVNHLFASTGSDGTIKVWDKDKRQRLWACHKYPGSIMCSAFNGDGSLIAYAVCPDFTPECRLYLKTVQ